MFETVSGEAFAAAADFRLSADSTEYQRDVAFARLGDGGFVAAWTDSRFGTGSLRMQRFDLNGAKAGPEILLPAGGNPTLTATPAGGFMLTWTVELAYPTSFEIRAQFYDSSLNPLGGQIPVNTTTNGFQYNPSVSALAGGGYAVIWEQPEDQTFDHVRGQILDSAGNKLGGEFIVTENVPGDKLSMGMAALGGGGFVAAWTGFEVADEYGNLSPGLRAQIFDAAGNKVGVAFSLNSIVPGYQGNSALAGLPGGGFVASWVDDGNRYGPSGLNGNQGVWVQLFDPVGQKVGTALHIGSDAAAVARPPTIAVTATGFLVVWPELASFYAGETKLRAQRFDFDGDPVGEQFVVGGSAAATHLAPASLVLDSGAIVLGWDHRAVNGSAYDDVRAQMLFPVTHGSEGADSFTGTASRDFYLLKGGNDLVSAGGGEDQIDGGDGDDVLTGGPGADSLDGGAGLDTADYSIETGGGGIIVNLSGGLVYRFGEAALQPGQALDSYGSVDVLANIENFRTGAADDYVIGDAAANRIETGGGRDILVGGAGADYLAGGDGDDQYYVYAADSAVFEDVIVELAGGGDLDQIRTTLAVFSLAGFPEIESLFGIVNIAFTLSGNDRDNYIIGNNSVDTLEGGLGNDKLEGQAGDDTMRGGLGDDEYVVDDIGDIVEENEAEGNDTVWTRLATYSLVGTNIENLFAASSMAHDFRGNAFDNSISGAGGNDFFRLQDGGTDDARGGRGNDVFLFGSTMDGLDSVDGGPGTDQIALQGGAAFTFGSGVIDIESLGLLSGADTRFGGPGGLLHSYNLTTRDINVASGVELVVDGAKLLAGENLTFNGSAETDGSFFIYGGRGIDTLTGGARNDVFLFGSDNHFGAGDVVNGGSAGTDQLALRGNYALTFGAGQLVGIESLGLLSAFDTRFGALGTTYSYNLITHDGNVAAGVQMTVDGAKLRGVETLVFNGAAETDGSFRIFGGINGDTLAGSQNADILQGNGGADTFTGGGGADQFRYASASDSTAASRDHILDFTAGTDKIDLSRIDANGNAAGDQAFSWIGANAFGGTGAASAGQLRAYQDGASRFVEGDTDGDGNADFVVMLTPQGPASLNASDFIL